MRNTPVVDPNWFPYMPQEDHARFVKRGQGFKIHPILFPYADMSPAGDEFGLIEGRTAPNLKPFLLRLSYSIFI